MNELPPNASPPAKPDEHARLRIRAAIDAIEFLALNLRTIRRSEHPPEAKHRIREILRLSDETVEILRRDLRLREAT